MKTGFLDELNRLLKVGKTELMSSGNKHYGEDIATNQFYNFDYLVKPSNAQEVAEIVKLCYRHDVPITPRGGGSGVSGGAAPIKGGLILSTENLNNLIEIDPTNKTAIVESGVLTDSLCQKAEEFGLYFPVSPSSGYMSFVGGNVAENSGSIHSLKYGSVADYVINLEVVLPNGEIIWTGSNTSKNATGLNLTQLLVGSEGTLGIITKVVFRLISKPHYYYSLKTEYSNNQDLCLAVQAISRSHLTPCAIELVDDYSANLTADYLSIKFPGQEFSGKAHLLVSFDGDYPDILDEELEKCYELMIGFNSSEVLVAKSHEEKQAIWGVRMNIGEALKFGGKGYRDIDLAVPVSRLYDYFTRVKQIAKSYNVSVACFGHAGNGNLHCMICLNHVEDLVDNHINKAIDEIYRAGIELGGTISGEHGIGILQKKFMPYQFSNTHLNIMANIKSLFDPKNLINPGKIFIEN